MSIGKCGKRSSSISSRMPSSSLSRVSSRLNCVTPARTSSSPSATPAPASPPMSCRSSSNASTASQALEAERMKVQGSGWHWFRSSCGCMAARLRPRALTAKARRSASASRSEGAISHKRWSGLPPRGSRLRSDRSRSSRRPCAGFRTPRPMMNQSFGMLLLASRQNVSPPSARRSFSSTIVLTCAITCDACWAHAMTCRWRKMAKLHTPR